MKFPRSALSALLLACTALPAAAHLGLVSPPSRYGSETLKFGPCGVPNGVRSGNVTEAEPGATLTVVWDEYIDHPGHFRVAFDAEGDDDFVDPRCLGGCNTTSPTVELYSNSAVLLDGIADTRGGQSSVQITLPDVECERCTLQVIQVMYDKPPYVVPGNDIYYQCVDLVLRRSTQAPTPTVTATASPTPSTMATVAPICGGDCDQGDSVDVDELITMVTIALGGADVALCDAGDVDGDGEIQVDEIVAAIQHSLTGC